MSTLPRADIARIFADLAAEERLHGLEVVAEADGFARDGDLEVTHHRGRKARRYNGRFSEPYFIHWRRLPNGMVDVISRSEALALLREEQD